MAGIRDAAADVSILAVLHSRVDMAHFYVGAAMEQYPWGLFDFCQYQGRVAVRPRKSYYAFKAFSILAQNPTRLDCQAEPTVDDGGCAVLASMDLKKTNVTILLSNYGTTVRQYRVRVANLPWVTPTSVQVRALDRVRNLETVRETEEQELSSVPLELDVDLPSVCLVRLAPWGL